MKNRKASIVAAGAAAVLTTLGVGGMAAQADTGTPQPTVQQQPDRDLEINDATEPNESANESGAKEVEDGPNQGPDVNANEPGHQDADESGEPE